MLSEGEIIDRILNCKNKYLSEAFKKFQESTKVHDSDTPVKGKYCVNIKAKRRYVVPLVQGSGTIDRVYNLSERAKKDIDAYLNFKTTKYAYFDFDFSPSGHGVSSN